MMPQGTLQDICFHWRPFLPDAKDEMLLELAVASQSIYIVTFNLKDFRGCEQFGIKAIKPQDFLLHIGEFS